MPQSQTNLAWDSLLAIDESAQNGSLHHRLKSALRAAIRERRLPAGSTLPPSRLLADQLGCSRWAVTEAYEQLIAEGYLEARIGSGTRVRQVRLESLNRQPAPAQASPQSRIDLRPSLPDLRAFPRAMWSRALRTVLATVPYQDLAYPPPGGHPQLRRVLADYLRRVRGTDARWEDITITTGIGDGIAQVCRALAAKDVRYVAVEDPTWRQVRIAVQNAGLGLVPITVDSEGMQVAALARSAAGAVVATPSHQFPTGAVLSPRRRTALLDWATSTGALIVEDDYDSEFSYDRRAAGTLQGIEPGNVVLLGSLSKTLSPAVSLGWMVSPPAWTIALRKLEARLTGPAVVDQLALARFIESGDYARHLRRVRASYKARRDRVVAALARRLPACEISGESAGLHISLSMPPGIRAVAVRNNAAGILQLLDPLECSFDATDDGSLVLGYGNLQDGDVERAIEELAKAVDSVGSIHDRRDPHLMSTLASRERIEKA